MILGHGDHGGPAGLFSVSGVKYTTSRLVAEKTMRRVFPGRTGREPTAAAGGGQFRALVFRL